MSRGIRDLIRTLASWRCSRRRPRGLFAAAVAYPLDGYEETGIRRLEG